MIIELINCAVMRLHAFPPASGMSKTFSPRTIRRGMTLDFKKHFKMPFGAYTESHEDALKTNITTEKNQCTICLGTSSIFQGSYKRRALDNGCKIIRKQFTELPMSNSVIKRDEALYANEKQGDEIIILFTDSNNKPNTNIDGGDNEDDGTTAGVYGGNNGHGGTDDDGGDGNHNTNDGGGNNNYDGDDELPGLMMDNETISQTANASAKDTEESTYGADTTKHDHETPGVHPDDAQ
jgi:hypothetical protein